MAQNTYALYQPMLDTPLQALLLLLLLILLLLVQLAKTTGSRKRLPPSPPGLPVIGHMHLVRIIDHVSLCNLAKKYGGMMLLRLGSVPYLVVSSSRAAKAIMRTYDHQMASRPPSAVADALLYRSSDLIFSPYGEQWRQMKKLVATHLLSVKKVLSYRNARQQEVRLVMAKIRDAAAASRTVDLSEMMNTFTSDLVCRALSGKTSKQAGWNKMFRELMKANTALFASSNLENCFPRLAKLLDLLMTRLFNVRNKGEELNRRWDNVLEMIIQNHEKSSRDDGLLTHEESDFIDALLPTQHERDAVMTRNHIKGTLMDMFGAGTETSFFMLDTAMAELMRRPEIMAKLQAEVRKETPDSQEMVEEEDLARMTFLKAVVKETLRLHPPLPLLLPHFSTADCADVDGYHVLSGTRVFINVWAIGRDSDAWENPEEFLPERFMEGGSAAAVDFRGNSFEFMPFGAGRRMCPGLNFGLIAVEIMLANLVYSHDWALPAGMEKEDIDMSVTLGISVRRKKKLELLPKAHV